MNEKGKVMVTISTILVREFDKDIRVEVPIDVAGLVSYSFDRAWGTDADGNRGTPRLEVTDVSGITAFDETVNEVILTKEEEDFVSSKLADKFLMG